MAPTPPVDRRGARFTSPDAGAVFSAVAIVEARRSEADRQREEAERRRARDRAVLRRPLMKAPDAPTPPPERRGGMHVR